MTENEFKVHISEKLARLETKLDCLIEGMPCMEHAKNLQDIDRKIYGFTAVGSVLAFIASLMFGG